MSKQKWKDLRQAILDNIPYLAWLKNDEGKYLAVNQAFADLYNSQPEQIIGKTDFDLCSRERALEFHRNDEEVKEPREDIL